MSGVDHATLAPSSAVEWVNCPGSIRLSAGVVEDETEAGREGTAVRWMAERMLAGANDSSMTAPNGVVFNDEMIEAAEFYVDEVWAHGLPVYVEQPVTMPEIHDDCWGTPDAWAWDQSNLTLHLWDLKYGFSPVDAYGNWQMIAYALGCLRAVTNNMPMQEYGITVEICIVQPRRYDGNGKLSRWTVKASDLRGFINQMHHAAHTALGFDPMLHVGPHCKHCKGRHQCPALLQAASVAVDCSMDSVPHVLSPDALAYEMSVLNQAVEIIKHRKDALEADAMARLMDGQQIPGYMTKQGQSNNRWLHGNDEVFALGDLMGVELRSAPKPVTPSQAVKLFKQSAIDPEVINTYYGRQPTSMKLVVDDGSKARRIFGEQNND